jgi:protein involved in polysaccharide export with SLBB domain
MACSILPKTVLADTLVKIRAASVFRLRSCHLSALSCVLFLLVVSGSGKAEDYTLDSGDALRVTVMGETNYPIEVTVDDRGTISLPLLGEVSARGLTTAGLAQAIKKEFKDQNLILDSFVQVDLRGYRPFFISGAVANAGSYPFSPGMTVRHALAIAGGFRALPVGETIPALRIADMRSERADLLIEEFRQRVRLEALYAEQKGTAKISVPADPPPEVGIALIGEIIESEQQQLQARQTAFSNEISYLEASLARARKDAETAAAARRDRESAASGQLSQVEAMRRLQTKGLATNTNVTSAERMQNTYLMDVTQAELQERRAEQEILTLQSDIRTKGETRRLDLLGKIQEAQLEIGKTQSKLRYVTDKLLFMWSYGPQRSLQDLKGAVRISIYRPAKTGTDMLAASEETPIKAGDVIEVSLVAGGEFYAPETGTSAGAPF